MKSPDPKGPPKARRGPLPLVERRGSRPNDGVARRGQEDDALPKPSSDFDDWGDGKHGDRLAREGEPIGPAWRGTGGSSGRGAYGGGREPGDERGGYASEGMKNAERAPYFGSSLGGWDERDPEGHAADDERALYEHDEQEERS